MIHRSTTKTRQKAASCRGRRKATAFPWRALVGAALALPGTASVSLAQAAPEACVAPGSSLRLDHVPVAVGDLDALSRRLTDEFGFHIQAPTRDESGLETAVIGFSDGTRLELRTVEDSGDPAGPGTAEAGRYAELIADGGGGAYLALSAPGLNEVLDATADLESGLAVSGADTGRRAAFPPDHPLHAVFLVDADQERTEAPEALLHANGAQGLQAVWVMVEDPERLTRFLLAFGARDCGPSRHPEHLYGRAVGIRGGTVYVVDALLWLADPGSAPVVSVTVRGGRDSVSDNIVLGDAGGLWIELRSSDNE